MRYLRPCHRHLAGKSQHSKERKKISSPLLSFPRFFPFSSMESDTDSGSSHISATPPRKSTPPQTILLSSSHKKSKVRVSSLSSNPKSLPSKRKKPHLKTQSQSQSSVGPESSDPSPAFTADLSDISGFSLRIHRPSDRNSAVSALNSVDQLPAGYFSKSASFSSRFKTRCPSFEPIEIEKDADCDHPTASPSLPDAVPPATGTQSSRPGHVSKSTSFSSCLKTPHLPLDPIEIEKDVNCNHPVASLSQPDAEPPVTGAQPNRAVDRVRLVKNHPNSICATICPLPVKRPKCVSEGNFVRLNINGYGHKFRKKGGRRKYPLPSLSRGRKSQWRSKEKSKSGSETEAVLFDEDGLVSKPLQQNGSSEFNFELIEKAVIAAREEPSDHNLKNLLKLTHGYDSFREGQLEAIKQVVAGQSTMLVLPTGAGKSLCYQLPALILHGVTLVVSPLVALMVDQLRKLPPMLHGGLLCSSQTSEEASETLEHVRDRKIKVLFVSPERFLNSEFLSKLGAIPLSLVVVDEAHCLSEWSHNFRPSYLRLRASLLRTKLNVECFLAMTATATTKTMHAIVCALEIPSTNIIQTSQIRENLQLNVTLSGNRMKDLIVLMQSSPLVEAKSIIVYCKFQSETDLVSKYLRDKNISAKSYHSGIPAKERSRIQELFCSNKIRVVVATVAFGMGLDKSDIGAVIHYSLPESLEEYVQETGRAGRDGRLSYCHLLLDDITYFKLRSLLHSDGVDEYAVNKFLFQVFKNDMVLSGNVCSLVKESASQKFDMKEEVMLTILTYMELGEVQYLRLLPQLNVTCSLNFHKTSPELLSSKDIVVATILKKSETKQGHCVFDIPTIANGVGITTTELLNQLHKLKVYYKIHLL
ncbi:ATP-dependent DNA helicase Q-like 5 isoform X2 [Magnolia sinica]|uniref:ATP-dependent DNA helicase Q-like 5 isoform X2 n=1 Tax=Magnolia sinica TaxID=86752 RepID=UPI002657E56B|nr:ATP-dependent DNA helicase Q-like 5 isoform X2 [Magnolia sinica]